MRTPPVLPKLTSFVELYSKVRRFSISIVANLCEPINMARDDADDAKSEESSLTVLIVFLVFLSFMVAITVHAALKASKKEAAADANLRASALAARGSTFLADHFIGGRDLGVGLTVLTILGSNFSGYTLVGIPADFAANGWVGGRWIFFSMALHYGNVAAAPRLRRLGLKRDYVSPLDFISDRFRSPVLHSFSILTLFGPSLMYLGAQVISLVGLIDGAFEGLLPAFPTTLVLCAVMILYEWFGGLKTVAITDALQGCLMFTGTIAGCFIISHYYGGFAEARDDLASDYPAYFNNPSSTTQIKLFSFEFSTSFYVFNGFVIMRIFAAKDYRNLKLAFCTLPAHIGLVLPGALTGLQGFSRGLATPTSAAVFAKVAHNLIGKGPFAATFMSLLLVAAMAAVMSTADSLLGMLSAVCANDIGRKFTDGKALPVNTVKAFSVAMMAAGICVYFLFDDLTTLFVLQSSFLVVGLGPAYIFGLFWPEMGAAPVLVGCLVGTAVALGITFGVDLEAQPELQALGNTIGFGCGVFTTIGSHAMQTAFPGSCVVRCLSYLAFLNVNSVEGFSNAHKVRYNSSFLDASAMATDGPLLKGLHEPLGCTRGKMAYGALVLVLIFFVPFYFEAEAEPTFVNGIPLWSFIQFVLFGVHSVLVWYLYSLWVDEDEEEDFGTPPIEAVEMQKNPLKAKLEAQWKAGSSEGTAAVK